MTEAYEYIVLWNGAHHGKDYDLLCVPAPVLLPDQPAKAVKDGAQIRADVLALLADGSDWRLRDIRAKLGLTIDTLYIELRILERQGVVTRSYGAVQLARHAEAA